MNNACLKYLFKLEKYGIHISMNALKLYELNTAKFNYNG